jgi:hypothetical protein
MSEERFSLIREPEAEALKSLSSNAAKAFIAIKFGRRDGDKIAFGVRDLEAWGLKRTIAAAALNELVAAGLLRREAVASFGSKRVKAVYSVTCTRKSAALQSAPPDTEGSHSPPERTMGAATVRSTGHKRALQSAPPDTSQETSSTSSRKSKEEEVSAEPCEGRAALREQLLRIDKAAKAIAMTGPAFMQKAGGPKPADFLARKFERGDLTALQLRAALADPPICSARGSEWLGPEINRIAERVAVASGARR